MKRKIFSLLLASVLLLICSMPAFAAGNLWDDEVGLLSDSDGDFVTQMPDSTDAGFGIQIVVSIIVGLVVAAIVTGSMKAELKTVRSQYAAGSYVRQNSLDLRVSQDIFLRKDLVRTPRPKKEEAPSAPGSQRGKF